MPARSASEFVDDFDDKVGLLPSNQDTVASITRNWPQFSQYEQNGDRCILYKFYLYVQGHSKQYKAVGWYAWLYRAGSSKGGEDVRVGIAFKSYSGIEYTFNDWMSSIGEHGDRSALGQELYRPDPGHVRQVVESCRDFVYNKLKPILKRRDFTVSEDWMPPGISVVHPGIAEALVEAMLEGEITRDRLNSIYNMMYKQADRTVKQHKPCRIQKDAEGKTICAGCKGHPDFDPRDRMNAYSNTSPNSLCCQGCEHHGEKGCKALKPLACKTWLCPTAANLSPQADKRLSSIANRAARAGVYDVRGSKQQSMDLADRRWKDEQERLRQRQREQYYQTDEAKQNRYNPMGLHHNHRGELLDKYGRVMTIDDEEFKRKRRDVGEPLKSPKVLNPQYAASIRAKGVAEASDSRDFVDDYFGGLEKSFTVVPGGLRTQSKEEFKTEQKLLFRLSGQLKRKPDTEAIYNILFHGKPVGEFVYNVDEFPDHESRWEHDEQWINRVNMADPYDPAKDKDFYDWLDRQHTVEDLPEPELSADFVRPNNLIPHGDEAEAEMMDDVFDIEAAIRDAEQNPRPMPPHVRAELLARLHGEDVVERLLCQ